MSDTLHIGTHFCHAIKIKALHNMLLRKIEQNMNTTRDFQIICLFIDYGYPCIGEFFKT